MEFFERAHVTRKEKKENKTDEAVKKQLKEMLHAFKKGNNQGIKKSVESEPKYDIDEVKSMSDYSDFSFHKEADTSQETESSAATEDPQSSSGQNSNNSYDRSVSNLNISQSDDESDEDSLESLTDFNEDLKSLSSATGNISMTDKDLSYDDSSILSGEYSDSSISIPSSLITSTGTDTDGSDDDVFDPDGELANRILEKLGKKETSTNKRKLVQNAKLSDTKITKKSKDKNHKEPPKQLGKNEKKTKNKSPKNTTAGPVNLRALNKDPIQPRNLKADISDYLFHEGSHVVSIPTNSDSLKQDISDYLFTEDSNLEGSVSTNASSPFISITATDMKNQSLSDIIGDYVNPTVRNLPSEKQNVIYSHNHSDVFTTEDMNVEDIDEEISSLIPELDPDIALEDLNLDESTIQPLESSTAYDDTILTDEITENELSTDILELPLKLYNGRNSYILVMKHPAELHIHGKVTVTALGGAVDVLGYNLLKGSINIFAPYCYYAHSLKTVENQNAFPGLFSKLTSAGLKVIEAEEIVTTISENDAVISISKLYSPNIDFVDNNFTETKLFSKRSDQTPEVLKRAAENLGCSFYVEQPKRSFERKNGWEQVISCGMDNQSRGVICGGKGTGKSTFLRYYVNRLLENGPVLVIDLDPGQAEFTVPGNISVTVVNDPLIGPNFTHLRTPEKTLNIGMINTMDNPARYFSAVYELITHCRNTEKYRTMPWIVNTMGMTNHMGLKFIAYIILQIQPTFVYQIDSKLAKNRFEFELHSSTIKNLYQEDALDKFFRMCSDPYSVEYTFIMARWGDMSAPSKGASSGFSLTAKDERYLNVLAYFGELLEIHRGKGILDIVPYEVELCNLNIGVNVKIPWELLTQVINGKIIALCQLAARDKGNMFTLHDKALLCHGHGLVRGIDFDKGLLYILTPVTRDRLKLVNTLVYADWMPELRGQEKELPDGTTIPYRTATVLHDRKLMFSPRRRFNPVQLLKVTRTS